MERSDLLNFALPFETRESLSFETMLSSPAFVNTCKHGRVLIFKCSFNLMPLSDHDVGQRRLADLERLVAQVLTV
jgi:hypothetical protein